MNGKNSQENHSWAYDSKQAFSDKQFGFIHKSGTIPDCKDALYILVSGFAKISAVSFNAFGCILSGPGDLFGLYRYLKDHQRLVRVQ
jgi:CRP-like cAMP-binding protein